MSRKYFFFLYPSENRIKLLLNLSVFALDPDEKWPAHVTVGGPFYRRPSIRKNLRTDRPVFALNVGNFFAQGLNTVFLRIGVPGIAEIWNKPDFIGNPVPHLSLYNGDSRERAKSLFDRLSEMRPHFSFTTNNLALITSVSGQQTTTLREQVDTRVLRESSDFTLDELRHLEFERRLDIAVSAIRACLPVRPQSNEQFFRITR